MKKHWNELQPADHYRVRMNGMIQEFDRKVITLLYQPLMGSDSLSLYLTLWAEIGHQRIWSEPSPHYFLMNALGENLESIFHARSKLEGMGLLKTFKRQQKEGRLFVYELQPPLSPSQYFSDGLLNIYLYRKIGQKQFQQYKAFFSDESFDEKEYQDITKGFEDVYGSKHMISPTQIAELTEEIEKNQDKQWISKSNPNDIEIKNEEFDFEFLAASLSDSFVSKKNFTPQVRKTIAKLAFLYGISPLPMKNLILSSVDENGELDIELVRREAREWFQLEKGEDLPTLSLKTLSPVLRTVSSAPQTKEEELIRYLETISPIQLLTDLGNGSSPSDKDMKIVEDVMFKQKLNPGVTNVLIQYVMIRTDKKLNKNFIETIASHWSRKNIQTVPEAMTVAKEEHKQYLSWTSGKAKENTRTRRNVTRTEKLPKWYNDKNNPTPQETKVDKVDNIDDERKKLEEDLKKYRK